MITVDALARELGCTAGDIAEELDEDGQLSPYSLITEAEAGAFRIFWSKRTGIDYTAVAARKTITDAQLYAAVQALGLDPHGVISIELTANPRTVHVKEMTNPRRRINDPENEYVEWSTETVQ